jgi:NAD(P)H dehydrogenase (quinone)
MVKVLVLYYSAYGHVSQMASAIADGARAGGAIAELKRVPELVPPEIAYKAGYRIDADTPLAEPEELVAYDAILIGTPTRFGNMSSQMKNFLDRCGRIWSKNQLVGKVGGAFTSSGSQHGGQEATLLSTHVVMLHLGLIVVGLPYTFQGQNRMDEITGGSPYGASTIAEGVSGQDRPPSSNELAAANFQGRHVARITTALAIGRRTLD